MMDVAAHHQLVLSKVRSTSGVAARDQTAREWRDQLRNWLARGELGQSTYDALMRDLEVYLGPHYGKHVVRK